MLRPEEKMNAQVNAPIQIIPAPERAVVAEMNSPRVQSKLRLRTLLAAPIAVLVALAVHLSISRKEPAGETSLYTNFLLGVLCLGLLAATGQMFWPGLRKWMRQMCPIIAAAILLVSFWEVITTGLRLLPLPYFPSPAGVLKSMVDDREVLFDSTWHSLVLL